VATSGWEPELKADANDEITNGAGYVGIDFIDDSRPIPYYRVNFSSSWGARDPSLFTIVLVSMNRDGKIDPEDAGTAIGWNPEVGRFQEIEPNGEEFAPEVKAPKHIRTSK